MEFEDDISTFARSSLIRTTNLDGGLLEMHRRDRQDLVCQTAVLDKAGWYAAATGKYEAAEEMNRRTLKGHGKVLGKEHPNTLTSVYNLAYLYHQQEQYKNAEVLDQKSIRWLSDHTWNDHPPMAARASYPLAPCSLITAASLANLEATQTRSAVAGGPSSRDVSAAPDLPRCPAKSEIHVTTPRRAALGSFLLKHQPPSSSNPPLSSS